MLVVFLLVALGAGIGTLVGDDPPTDDGDPPVVTLTPTETPTGGSGGVPSGPATPSDTATPTETPDGAGTPAPTETPNETATPTDDGRDDDDRDGDDRDDDDDDRNSDGGTSGSGGGGTAGGSESGGSGGSGGDGSTPAVRLEAVGPTTILNYDGVAPEDTGRDEVRLRNSGNREARLAIADVNVTDRENGVLGPEAALGDTGADGELSEHVSLVVEAHFPDGTVDYLYGTSIDDPRSLAAIGDASDAAESRSLGPGESATVAVDWHVPATTGNEIQSDSTEVGVTFELRAD